MSFENLSIWKRSSRLCVEVYRHLNTLKDFGFKDQITRSALSIPSNIAEGIERTSPKEQRHFLAIARGSAAELRTQVYIGIEIGYIQKQNGQTWIKELKELTSMTQGLINSITDN